MDRRHFLRWGGFITTSTVLTACGGGGDGGFVPILPVPPVDNGNLATGTNWKFPQSVASGDPRPDSVLLWTRVVPGDAHDVNSNTAADFSVRLRVTAADNAGALGSNTALGGTLVLDTTVPVQAQWDHTVRHRLNGLEPGRTYYYQFVAGDVRSRLGRFRTAPAVDAAVPRLKFAFLSCQDWSINHWGTFSDLATQELDFVVHLGDYIYETVGEAFQIGAVESRHGLLTLPDGASKGDGSNARYATTLADYRYLYKSYRSDARLQAVHERFAFVAVWDDHEFTDDAWQDAQTYSNGGFSASTGGDNTRQRARRRSANQAWFEFMLADIAFDEKTTGIDSVKIYRDLRFGRLAHLVMTDERLYRSDHVVPEAMPNPATGAALGSIGSRYMVPQPLITALEQQKIAATRAAQPGGDALANVSILGSTQRAWWKSTMAASNATWKLWGNEVSLLRMGLDGTQAIGTLVALQSIATLAAQIGEAAPVLGGNVPAAAALVAAVAAGASQATAAAGAMAIANGGAAAGVAAGLTATQAGLAEQALIAARNARGQAAVSVQAQATAGAQVIAFGYVKADVIAKKAASPFVVQAGMAEALGPYFTKFLINCDQWDGYGAERREMLAHLRERNVRNVVALTGDIHAFFAGAVHDDFDAEGGGTPVMVDLVTAGVSSDSFFNYLSSAADGLAEGLSTLVYYPLTLPVPQVGNVRVNVNLLDYTLGLAAPSSEQLATQIRVPLRGALAAAGVPEAQLDATTTAVLGALQQSEAFTGQLLPLAQQLASLRSNPWLALSQTDAQGYALVTLTEEALRCEFRQVNRLVGGQAPAAPTTPLIARSLVATVRSGVPAVTMG